MSSVSYRDSGVSLFWGVVDLAGIFFFMQVCEGCERKKKRAGERRKKARTDLKSSIPKENTTAAR